LVGLFEPGGKAVTRGRDADMKIEAKYDKKADSVYLHFSDKQVAYSKRLDAERIVDYSEEGEIRGIKFLSARSGVKIDDLPYKSSVEPALHDKGIITDALTSHVSRDSDETHVKAPLKDRIVATSWAIVAILFGIGFTVVDILLARNLFVLSSLEGILASMFGLVAAMFPTVLGYYVLLAWVIDTRSQTGSL